MTKTFIAIFLGGGLGSIARYGAQLLMHERIVPYIFPWATFTVNIAGSFIIGLCYALAAKYEVSDELRLFLTAGVCGGFTTFSTFSNDSLALLKSGEIMMFALYVALSIMFGIAAVLAGASLGK